jgi:hypothetical protein
VKASAREERIRKSTSIPVSSSRLFDSSRCNRMPSWAISARGPGMPNPLTGLSPPYAKPDAWLPIASRSTTTLRTPDFAR